MMLTNDREQTNVFGIDTSGVLGVCSGLFFLVLLSQIQIREQFSGSSIVYIEFFYPLMYMSLLGVSVNSYLLSRRNTETNIYLEWINYENNIIPKLIYWPVLLGSTTLITAVILLPQDELSKGNQSQDTSVLDHQAWSKNPEWPPQHFELEGFNHLAHTSYQTLLPISSFSLNTLHQDMKSKKQGNT